MCTSTPQDAHPLQLAQAFFPQLCILLVGLGQLTYMQAETLKNKTEQMSQFEYERSELMLESSQGNYPEDPNQDQKP